MISYINVIGLGMKTRNFTWVDDNLTVLLNNMFILLQAKFFKNLFIHDIFLQASLIAIYYASVVDKATHFCNLDCHGTAPPANLNEYPDMDLLESITPAISASVAF